MSKSEKLHKEICPQQILFDFNFISALVTPPSFHHWRDEMTPPLSGEPPLKGEVAKIDNFNCQFLTEGSGDKYLCSSTKNQKFVH